jgi:peptide/nickel transport system substrate-binding protein
MRIGVGVPQKGVRGSGVTSVINALRFETWLTGRPDGTQSERIVKDWSWDDSRTRLTLKLRQDVFFHDGTRLTPEIAADCLRTSIANALDEALLSFTSIKQVVVTGPDTVELRLSEPNAFVVPDLSLNAVTLPGTRETGTGPFKVVKRDPTLVQLEAYDKYYRGRPAIDRMELVVYPTQRNAWTALMRGDVDMLHEVSRDAAEFVAAETTLSQYAFRRPYYIALVFNLRHPILKNREVRKALNEALDKATLVNDGMNGLGRPADGPIWPEHWAHFTPSRPFDFNPAAARDRLDRAGLTPHKRPEGMPARFSFTCLLFADDTRFERLALLVQKELAEVGVDMKVEPVKQAELEARLKAGNFDGVLFEFFGRSLSWAYEFWRSHNGMLMNSGYTAADGVLDKMRASLSDDNVRRTMAEFGRILSEDPPAAFIAWQKTTRAVSKNFDVAEEKDRDILTNAWQWRLVTDRTKQADR